jgi:hypothetical protein
MVARVTPNAAPRPSRLPLFLGLGCVTSLLLFCVVSVGAFFAWRYYVAEAARSHATSFLYAFVAHDYANAHAIGTSRYDTLHSVADYTSCFSSTPLAAITAADCTAVDLEPDGHLAHVSCTVTTATGPTVVTVDVNDPTREPYNGFVWFSPDAVVGPAWHADACAAWSGRAYFRDPPPGRVRP